MKLEIIKDSINQKLKHQKPEDPLKLTIDYQRLAEKYSRSDLEKVFYQKGIPPKKFPVVRLAFRKINEKPFNIEICGNNKEKQYKLPQQICDMSAHLMKAHRQSYCYNRQVIRLDDLEYNSGAIKLLYSNTTYFNSLVTNRAMDYDLKEGYRSIREIYEPGPFISSLRESQLSNHIGYNGIIETSDNMIILTKRSNNVSIGKTMLSTSIAASLKTEFAYNNQKELTLEGISNAIKEELSQELFIKINKDEEMDKTIFAFYRDLVEGGKPQFLFYHKLKDKTFADILMNFKPTPKDINENIVDADELIPIPVNRLNECKIDIDKIGIPWLGQYTTNPSVAISLIYLKRFLPLSIKIHRLTTRQLQKRNRYCKEPTT